MMRLYLNTFICCLSLIGLAYSTEAENSLARADRVLLCRSASQRTRRNAILAMHNSIRPLTAHTTHPIIFELPPVASDSSLTFIPLNPSIRKTADGYDVLCRITDFYIGGIKIDPRRPGYTTRNFLLRYTKDLTLISQKEILNTIERQRFNGSPHLGQIDCRLIDDPHHPQALSMLCTMTDTNKWLAAQICYCQLREEEDALYTETLIPLFGPSPGRWEKNWLPFFKNNALHVIYLCDPFLSYTVDTETGVCTEDVRYTPPYRFDFSGSAPPVVFDQGYLFIIHARNEKRYTHRFVYMNQDLVITKVSLPFTFQHLGVEFCCGMTLDHDEENLLITYGVEDKKAYIAMVDLTEVRSMLYDLPAYTPFR